ncbi:MAG: ElyC/SanA/YdcF family protein [Myxococcota bacterium]
MVRRLLVLGFLGMTAWVAAAEVWVGQAGAFVATDLAAIPQRSVAIVPGARVDPDGTPCWFLARRLDAAVALYQSGRVGKILVSGDHGRAAYDETNAMRRYLLARDIPDRDVFMDHAGFRTRDTMERAARVFGVRDAVVCTQGLHADRTAFLARAAGIDAIVLAVDGDQWMSLGAEARELAARLVAAVDVIVDADPARLGPPIDIHGDGAQTHDAASAASVDP